MWIINEHEQLLIIFLLFQVVNTIGNMKTHPKSDKPYDDIAMVSVSVRNPVTL